MSSETSTQYIYIYRRDSPSQVRDNELIPDVFLPAKGTKGLSVYLAHRISPRGVLQKRIDDWRAQVVSGGEDVRKRAAKGLQETPSVESMVEKGWKILRISLLDIEAMGFEWEETDAFGHVNILGERELFKNKRLDFFELVSSGRAILLTDEECLAEEV